MTQRATQQYHTLSLRVRSLSSSARTRAIVQRPRVVEYLSIK